MQMIELRRWNRQFSNPKVIRQIRRIILNKVKQGHCTLLYRAETKGLTPSAVRKILQDFPEDKVRLAPVIRKRGPDHLSRCIRCQAAPAL